MPHTLLSSAIGAIRPASEPGGAPLHVFGRLADGVTPAVHAAHQTPVTTDYFGAVRSISYDLGAHELSVALGR